jgi:hypothetical protein
MFLKRDPGPCPVDDAAHTSCTAPTSSNAIVGGRITPVTSITVSTPTAAAAPDSPPPPFTTGNYRRGKKTPPPDAGGI